MSEENNGPVTPPPPPPPQQPRPPERPAPDLKAELERARAGNKLLKIAAAVLGVLFVVMAAAAFYIYSRVSSAAKQLETLQNYLPPPAAGSPETRSMPAPVSSLFGIVASSSSGLGLISGSMPEGGGGLPSPEEAQNVANAFAKYADRPVVKEFLADMKKDPELAALLEKNKGGNPLAVLGTIKSSKTMQGLAAKYAMRPDFMKLIMEVSADPAIKPLMRNVPGGLPQLPASMPQVPAAQEPAPQQEQAQAGDSAPMTLDTSVISGPAAAQPAPAKAKKAPPPVDSQ
jgi:hypothetical protein